MSSISWARQCILSGVAGVMVWSLSGQDAQAGPFLDWLFGQPVLVYPSPYVAGYGALPAPYVAGYGAVPVAAQPAAVAPALHVSGYAPAIAAPAAVFPVTVMVSQPITVGYAPTYRTVWNRVPITYYRPVTTVGYPAVSAVPCNVYGWQAQRVPTVRYRPWFPFVPAPVTYGFAPAPVTTAGYAAVPAACGHVVNQAVGYAPVVPTCPICPAPGATANPLLQVPAPGPAAVSPLPISPGIGTGSAPAAYEGPVPTGSSFPGAADQAPSLLPGSYPVSPASNTQPAAVGTGVRPVTSIPAEPTMSDRDSASPYRVTPIPAPNLRGYPSREAPQAPPLLPGRDRTAYNGAGEECKWQVQVQMAGASGQMVPASWATPKPQPAAPAKPLWKDGGWKSQ